MVARELERKMPASALAGPLVATTLSRLLIDPNRSQTHPRLFSEWSRAATSEDKRELLALHRGHRAAVQKVIERALRANARVVHVAVHSFTPVLDGEERNADIGLLYDPSRAWERTLCQRWQALFDDELRVRRNYPYRGTADGLTTALRRRYPAARYAGIELELGQALVARPGSARNGVVRSVERSLRALLSPFTARATSDRR